MKATAPSPMSFNDMLFEHRNKNYGAYELRQNYERRLLKALFIAFSLISIFFLLSQIVFKSDPATLTNTSYKMKDQVVLDDNFKIDQPISLPAVSAPATGTLENNYKVVRVLPPETQLPVASTLTPVGSGTDLTGTGTGDVSSTATGNTQGNVDGFLVEPAISPVLNIASVDIRPEFPGGIEKFYKYLLRHLRFTPAARAAGLQGRYYVSFVVSENGQIESIKILQPIGYGQEQEVESVLKNSPAWTPGKYQGKNVNTQMVLPVNFSLQK